ncbi:MAG: single-stranded-DNA-specific exonuclease RecJ, partial [Planctomycetota bacterium]
RGHRYRWLQPAACPEAQPLADQLKTDPLVATLLHQRGYTEPEAARQFLDPTLADLHDHALLPGCRRAAERLVQAVREKQNIVIYGDYDVDGVTATAILFHILKAADPGANINRYVPHRIDEGYGINPQSIETLADEGAQLIVSVDCGITATEPARCAAARGVDLIITDHHEPPDELPDAHTLVHPMLAPEPGAEPYPWTGLCGAGVAYKIAWQFAREFCGSDRVSQAFRTTLVDTLAFAALGTIADVVPLTDENRTITMFGLKRVKHTPFPGLNALIDSARLRDEKIDSYHVGFVLGPRLNAVGRLGHAKEAIQLFTDPTPSEARVIADDLQSINEHRQATTREITDAATQMVRDAGYDRPGVHAIVLAHEDWHPGVVGIVCSRLVEEFGRPTILLNLTDDGQAQGSARSIDAFNIHAALTHCAEHLERFGGHAMAAGMRLDAEHIPAFRQALIDYAAERLTPEDLIPTLQPDAELTLQDLDTTTVKQLNRLAPFGRGNPKPLVLIQGLTLRQPARTMGAQARHLNLTVQQDNQSIRCVGWSMGDLARRLPAGVGIDLIVEPTLNTYQGRTTVELIIKDLRWR